MKKWLLLLIALIISPSVIAVGASKEQVDLFRILFFGGPIVIVGAIFWYTTRRYITNQSPQSKPFSYLSICNYTLIFSNIIFEIVFFDRLNNYAYASSQTWLYLLLIIPAIVVVLLILLMKRVSGLNDQIN